MKLFYFDKEHDYKTLLNDKHPKYEEVLKVIYNIGRGHDKAYDIGFALMQAMEHKDFDFDNFIQSYEPDIYTSDLTTWLGSKNDFIYYLTDAIKEGAQDGFQALSMAQSKYIYEVATALYEPMKD